ncbi:MAG TPA: hypothetical protein VL485_11295 [Ktedonobacteraceae bacterium]|nr:hypothetical protein [Ktedonobacteraceae bacterium]
MAHVFCGKRNRGKGATPRLRSQRDRASSRTPFRCGFMASLLAWGAVPTGATKLIGESPSFRDIAPVADKPQRYKGGGDGHRVRSGFFLFTRHWGIDDALPISDERVSFDAIVPDCSSGKRERTGRFSP